MNSCLAPLCVSQDCIRISFRTTCACEVEGISRALAQAPHLQGEMAQPLRLQHADVSATERQHSGPITGLAIVGHRLFNAGEDERILCFEGLPKGPCEFVGPELRASSPVEVLRAVPGEDDRHVVAAACRDNYVHHWAFTSADQSGIGRSEENLLKGHSALVCSVDIMLPVLLSASEDTTVCVWDIETQKTVVALSHPRGVEQALFFPGTSSVVTACKDHVLRVWDRRVSTTRPRPSCVIQKPNDRDPSDFGSLAVTTDQRLACSDGRGQVRLFDVPRCGARCAAQFQLPAKAPVLQFVVDGRYLAGACRDGDIYTVRLEDFSVQQFEVQADPKTPISLLCSSSRGPNFLLRANSEPSRFSLLGLCCAERTRVPRALTRLKIR
jgi:WD40 repeat protein